jgi:Caspase domain
MIPEIVYQSEYRESWALVIGIDSYSHLAPLSNACEDAQAIADVLIERFSFPFDQVCVLLDADATRGRITSSFLHFATEDAHPDDRVVFFFAGHGLTRNGRRGEVGYLVPHDGDPSDLATLVRWDELTRNAELCAPKHIVFLMDACYGGLAVRRAPPAGSTRFLKDMLRRYSRQVLSAGKADEAVADGDGPRENHSMFTGHLLDAFEGRAADGNGVISANAVMSYVYDHVAKDQYSGQTPHYGFIDGDGDLIFQMPALGDVADEEGMDVDTLVQVHAHAADPTGDDGLELFADQVKDLLSDSTHRIRLDDLVSAEVRRALSLLGDELFPMNDTQVTGDTIACRLRQYERAMRRVLAVAILLAKWAGEVHQPALERLVSRLADVNCQRSGTVVWLGLRWYPISLLMYTAGVSALSVNNYASVATMLTTHLSTTVMGEDASEAIVAVVDGILEAERLDAFKLLPRHEKHHVPRSEYMFKEVQPDVEDLLFLGSSYESLFDRFEVLQALVYADLAGRESAHVWGPPGRFCWKHARRHTGSPFVSLVEEAKEQGVDWQPLKAGLFSGSLDRFVEIATAYGERLNRLTWF